MTAGTIEVVGVALPGGKDRASVVILLPATTYSVTQLNPGWNWHGAFYASEWEPLVEVLVAQQRIPGTCSDGDGCSTVDVLVVGPNRVISQYQETGLTSISCGR